MKNMRLQIAMRMFSAGLNYRGFCITGTERKNQSIADGAGENFENITLPKLPWIFHLKAANCPLLFPSLDRHTQGSYIGNWKVKASNL
jgi:hypothetical protein